MKKAKIIFITSVIGTVIGIGIGVGVIGRGILKRSGKNAELAQKHLQLYLLMNQWVKVKQKNKSIVEYLRDSGYKKIAVYGMNYVGETLIDELKGSDIRVVYGIDKNASDIYSDIDVVTPDEELANVDAVIVTPITFFSEIEDMLSLKMDCPILSIEDILYDV